MEKTQDVRMLKIEEVMDILRLSRSAVYLLTKRKIDRLPSVKMGKSRRYAYHDLVTWMEKLVQ